jgi:hypothetical protein
VPDEESDCREAARVLYSERDGVFSRTIRWALLFTRYRFQLAEELQRLHGGRARLMTPALVDFTAWFGPLGAESGDRTVPMRGRSRSWRVSRDAGAGRACTASSGFDPLRQRYSGRTAAARGRAAGRGEEGGHRSRLHRA